MQRAAERAAHDHDGVIGYRIVQQSDLRAPFVHRTYDVELAAIFDGEHLVAVRVLRDVQNGHEATDAEKARLASDLEAGQQGGGFAVPFDARHFAEYRYSLLGPARVRFESLQRDARHGDGTFDVDASGNVVRLDYIPNVPPKYANSGTVSDMRAEVLPGFWATVREEQHYAGHYGPFTGNALLVVTESGFVRFADRAAAQAALENGQIGR